MNLKQIKKIFGNTKNAQNFLQQKHPTVFTKKGRDRTKKYHTEDHGDIYQYILDKASLQDIRDFIFGVVTNSGGKFYVIHTQRTKAEKLLDAVQQKCECLREELGRQTEVCMPDKFSDQIVKPKMRDALSSLKTVVEQKQIVEEIKELAELHYWERELAQLKGDIAEYNLLIQASQYLIPTLKHNAGTDFFLIDDMDIADLDIKTSVWPSFFNEGITPQEGIRLLYENQGDERFSKEPRLYLIRPSKENKTPQCNLNLKEQLFATYDITFNYTSPNNAGRYNVEGCRIIFLK